MRKDAVQQDNSSGHLDDLSILRVELTFGRGDQQANENLRAIAPVPLGDQTVSKIGNYPSEARGTD